MPFFKNPDVEKKYQNTKGDADPVVRVAIQYVGKLSGVPLNIADKLFADGAHISIRQAQDDTLRQAQDDTPKKTNTK